MVTKDAKTLAKQDNFVCGLLSGLIFLSFPTKDLFTSNILFDVAQYSLKDGMTHSHHIFIVFIFRRVFDRQFLHDVVEIAPFFILMIQNFESYKNC